MLVAGTSLACMRGGLPIFRDVNFTVTAGEALVLTGPNGSGKTTLLRVIGGLLRPSEGGVRLEGAGPDAVLAEEAHYLAHLDPLKPSLTVAENLTFWTKFMGGAGAADEALAAVRLERLAQLPAGYLSAGQRRRLSLARLLAVRRPIWLLDEPTAALDAAGQVILADIMRQHLASGGLIIAATHGPLGLEDAKTLEMGDTRSAAGEGASPSAQTRGHAPSPDFSLRSKSTSPRKRGEVEASSLSRSLGAILARDLKVARRVGGGALMGVLFFLAVVTLVPFALGPDLGLLRRVGPAILWIGALLASLLALDRLLAVDQEDGSLDLIVTASAPLELVVAIKAIAHWLTTGVPLVIAAPLFGVMLNIEPAAIGAVTTTLLVGTPALTFIGLIGAALSVALRRGGILLPILVLPLTVPVLIFGVAAANAARGGPVGFGTPLTILCALTLMSLVVGPFAAAATLRHME
ncbi:MAG: heme exporter protein CcmB [Xanthobacteraceae bacterium]|nr:heme exporter protein CcmB [Xanthobacteraceae bacterium]